MTFVREVSVLAGATLDCRSCLCCFLIKHNWSVCSLQEENSTLALENESQREQYERCLDEVSAHLVYLYSFQATFKDVEWLVRCFTYLETEFVLTE